jgi:CBS domain-containing protein
MALQRCGLHPPFVAHGAAVWIDASASDELALSVLADRRLLWGTPVDPLPVAQDGPRERLLAALASEAFTRSLPTGFDAGAVLGLDGRHEQLNLREAAIVPIAAIARWAAAVADAAEGPAPRRPRAAAEGSTPERLRAAAGAGVLTADQAQTLAEAFELVLELRIVHQMEQIAAGRPPDDVLDPATMTPLSRGHLREVFRAVSSIVRRLAP